MAHESWIYQDSTQEAIDLEKDILLVEAEIEKPPHVKDVPWRGSWLCAICLLYARDTKEEKEPFFRDHALCHLTKIDQQELFGKKDK